MGTPLFMAGRAVPFSGSREGLGDSELADLPNAPPGDLTCESARGSVS